MGVVCCVYKKVSVTYKFPAYSTDRHDAFMQITQPAMQRLTLPEEKGIKMVYGQATFCYQLIKMEHLTGLEVRARDWRTEDWEVVTALRESVSNTRTGPLCAYPHSATDCLHDWASHFNSPHLTICKMGLIFISLIVYMNECQSIARDYQHKYFVLL